jgi:hypothetical protein
MATLTILEGIRRKQGTIITQTSTVGGRSIVARTRVKSDHFLLALALSFNRCFVAASGRAKTGEVF